MRLSKKRFIFSIAAVAVLASFQALSDSQSENMVTDIDAFDEAWTGEYYAEPSSPVGESFKNFESKRHHYLESPNIGIEELELVENENLGAFSNRAPRPQPTPSPSSIVPSWRVPYPGPWEAAPTLPWRFPMPMPSPSPKPTYLPFPLPSASSRPQAFYFYDRGSLKNASQLENEGKGFVKVFRDRDEIIGGRAWGTRALIGLIRRVSWEFADRFPGRERLQIADITRRNGGKMSHGSHQNGLDADIVYVRKNRKEQLPFGGYGKNGFAEQFVVRVAKKRSTKDSHGKNKTVVTYAVVPSANFDTEANFNLLLMFEKSGNVKTYFIDKVLIRELFRYAESHALSQDPDVQKMLMKLDHEECHADHFHIRLLCQEGDMKCVSSNSSLARGVWTKKKGA